MHSKALVPSAGAAAAAYPCSGIFWEQSGNDELDGYRLSHQQSVLNRHGHGSPEGHVREADVAQ